MLKRYNVTIDGVTYTVDVDEVDMEMVEDREALQEEIKVPVDIKPARGLGKPMIPVVNPFDCEIIEVRAKDGQQVKEGDILAVVKVMDVENEILAPDEGEVTRILVEPGEMVEAGTTIIEIH